MLILVFDQASKPHNKSNSFQYLYGGGGGVISGGGVHDHNRIYFLIQVDGSITGGGELISGSLW